MLNPEHLAVPPWIRPSDHLALILLHLMTLTTSAATLSMDMEGLAKAKFVTFSCVHALHTVYGSIPPEND